MKNKFKILVLMLFISLNNISAQNDLLNIKKYWYYHYRLVNDFMAKGDCQGCSEVINQRGFVDDNGHIAVKWGDQTRYLGQYIAVLATEYKLLSDQSQPTDTTLQELYYAIRAFNRLDLKGEAYYAQALATPWNQTNDDLNGFFVRDDVPSTFLDDHPRLANGVTSTRPVVEIQSDYQHAMSDIPYKANDNFTTSHDQIWELFMGFALVKKFLPSGVTYKNLPLNDVNGNSDIPLEVTDISKRIMKHLMDNNWKIINPVVNTHTAIGWEVIELSYGAGEAACYLNNGDESYVPGFPIRRCSNYDDFSSLFFSEPWMDFGRGYFTLYPLISYEDYKLQTLAAIGDSWWTRSNPFLPDPIPTLVALFDPTNFLHPWTTITVLVNLLPIPPVNVTTPELALRASLQENWHFPILRQVLHGGSNPIPADTYTDMLNSAPCVGPYFFHWPDNSATFEWSSSDRLNEADSRGGSIFPGEYSGVDYMLYYNLYHIIAGNTVPEVNYMDRVITLPFPIGVTGTLSSPAIIEAFNTITVSAVSFKNSICFIGNISSLGAQI